MYHLRTIASKRGVLLPEKERVGEIVGGNSLFS
jgi:hypothetical protein